MTEIVSFSTSRIVREMVDKMRGDIARSKFISRMIEDAIRKHIELPTTGQTSGERTGKPIGKKFIRGDPTNA